VQATLGHRHLELPLAELSDLNEHAQVRERDDLPAV
jgi:hypothetical protein